MKGGGGGVALGQQRVLANGVAGDIGIPCGRSAGVQVIVYKMEPH